LHSKASARRDEKGEEPKFGGYSGRAHPPSDPYCLDGLQQAVDSGLRELNGDEVRWLLAEAQRTLRAHRALDARVAELEREFKAKDSDYTGVCLEYADLADENARLKQEIEINRIVLDARDRTILELQKQLPSTSDFVGGDA
jgi:hypothetical protein